MLGGGGVVGKAYVPPASFQHGGTYKLYLFAGSLIEVAVSLVLWAIACVSVQYSGKGFTFETVCYGQSAVAGLAGWFAARHTSYRYTAVFAFLQGIALAYIVLVYSALGFDVIFFDMRVLLPTLVWVFFLAGLLVVASLSSAADRKTQYFQASSAVPPQAAWHSNFIHWWCVGWLAVDLFFLYWAVEENYLSSQGGNVHHLNFGILGFTINAFPAVIGLYASKSASVGETTLLMASAALGAAAIVAAYSLGINYHLTVLKVVPNGHFYVVDVVPIFVWVIAAGVLIVVARERRARLL